MHGSPTCQQRHVTQPNGSLNIIPSVGIPWPCQAVKGHNTHNIKTPLPPKILSLWGIEEGGEPHCYLPAEAALSLSFLLFSPAPGYPQMPF